MAFLVWSALATKTAGGREKQWRWNKGPFLKMKKSVQQTLDERTNEWETIKVLKANVIGWLLSLLFRWRLCVISCYSPERAIYCRNQQAGSGMFIWQPNNYATKKEFSDFTMSSSAQKFWWHVWRRREGNTTVICPSHCHPSCLGFIC